MLCITWWRKNVLLATNVSIWCDITHGSHQINNSCASMLSSAPLHVLQISDPHLFAQPDQVLLNVNTQAALQGVVAHIIKSEDAADLVLATGDITQDGSVAGYQTFLNMVKPVSPLVRGLPGNHDHNDNFYNTWGDHATSITDIGDWRIVTLDSTIHESSAGHLADGQLDLLRNAAANAGNRHVLVALHHNPIPVGSAWLDTMMVDNGHALLDIAARYPVIRGVVWGHVHQEFDSVVNFGTHQTRLMAAPATCLQFAPRSATFALDTVDPGYRRLCLHCDGTIDSEVIRVAGLGIRPDTASSGY